MEDRKPLSRSMPRTRDFQDSWRSPGLKPGRYYQEPCDRSRKAEWDAREMRTATTKVRREVYEEFRRICEARKTTPYAVLQDLLKTWIRKERQLQELRPAEVKRPFDGFHSSGGG